MDSFLLYLAFDGAPSQHPRVNYQSSKAKTRSILNAAEQGNPTAQYHLGLMYGCAEASLAVKWIQSAAAQGFGPAVDMLARLKKENLMLSSWEYAMEEVASAVPRADFVRDIPPWARAAAASSDVYRHQTLPLTATKIRSSTSVVVVHNETGERTATTLVDWDDPSGYIECFCLHPLFPNIIATGSETSVAKVWDTATGECTATLIGHEPSGEDTSVRCIDWHPFLHTIIATGGDDRTAKVWDTTNGQCTITLAGHMEECVGAIKWHPTSMHTLATGSFYSAKVWDTVSGECIADLTGHTSYVVGVSWHPHLNILATAGYEDKTAKVWDTTSGECLATLRADSQRELVVAVDWNPATPNILATTEGEFDTKTLKLWAIPGLSNPFWSTALHCTASSSISPIIDSMLPSALKFARFVMLVGEAMHREIEIEGNDHEDGGGGSSGGGGEITCEPIPQEIWLHILTFLKVSELSFRK